MPKPSAWPSGRPAPVQLVSSSSLGGLESGAIARGKWNIRLCVPIDIRGHSFIDACVHTIHALVKCE